MELEDRYVTATPEGVNLELVLAGLGSRFIAYLVDFLIQAAALIVVILGLFAVGDHSSQTETYVLDGIGALAYFLVFFGYFVMFEALDSGRSPGKRMVGLRVVKIGGGPVGFSASLLRNVARLIDMQPSLLYAVGSVLILATKANQRLGDLLGGTLVIRERLGSRRASARTGWTSPGEWAPAAWQDPHLHQAGQWQAPGWQVQSTRVPPAVPPEAAHWDVTAVSAEEIAIVRSFLANRGGYVPAARHALALDLANRLWPKVAGPAPPIEAEHFLELVSMVKAGRG